MKHSVVVCCIVIAYAVGLITLFIQSGLPGREYHSHFGKAYLNNHVYQTLMAATAKEHAGRDGLPGSPADPRDVTEEYRRATAGETYPQLVAEFSELGYQPLDRYIPGTEYLLTLKWNQIPEMNNPEFGFFWISNPDIVVRIKYNSDTHYQIEDATVVHHMNTL